MRYTGPKNRLARQIGLDLGLKTPGSKSHARLLKKLNVLPGQHGINRKRKLSERGRQLQEKQKLKYIFGINEKQLKRYFKIGSKRKGNTALYLSQFLEKRLDNIVYRLGFAPTRAAARQLVCHGHIAVSGKKLTVPSYQLKINDVVSFSNEKIIEVPQIEKTLNNRDIIIPPWLKKQGISGKLMSEPTSEEITKQIDLRLIIEYYSR